MSFTKSRVKSSFLELEELKGSEAVSRETVRLVPLESAGRKLGRCACCCVQFLLREKEVEKRLR